MFTALNLSRIAAIASTVGGALIVFGNAVNTSGKTGIGAAVAGLLAVWLHEEHATERNTTTAASQMAPTPPPPLPTPADLSALVNGTLGSLGAQLAPPPAGAPVSQGPSSPPAAPGSPPA